MSSDMSPMTIFRCLAWALGIALAFVLGTACDGSATDDAAHTESATPAVDAALTARDERLLMRFSPLGEPPVDETNAVVGDERAARLGQFLFFDQRLSKNGEVSCASCHKPEQAFSTAAPLAEGLEKTPRHAPTLLNVGFHHWYNWDGSADSLWAQAIGPLENPSEMGFTRTGLVHLVANDQELRDAYEAIFAELPALEEIPGQARPVPESPDHPHHKAWAAMGPANQEAVNRVLTDMAKALAAYQNKLVRGHAPFDTFVEGLRDNDPQKVAVLSASARRGAKLFLGEAGCANCHTGPNFSDASFHNLGLGPRDWLAGTDHGGPDEGRWDGVSRVKASQFNSTGAFSDDTDGKRARWNAFLRRTSEDHGQFKTPSLRNVAVSAPYMHGGHFETLEDVVRFYVTLGEQVRVGHREEMLVPLALSERDIDDLVAFLESLTGEPLGSELLHPPASPTSPTLSER
jgi:cytochrome c peroxidase